MILNYAYVTKFKNNNNYYSSLSTMFLRFDFAIASTENN